MIRTSIEGKLMGTRIRGGQILKRSVENFVQVRLAPYSFTE